ncbi:hypothetical protein [Parapedobacter tibetensis]|uniref:hypothetical protein n=2 Tax=Parapedobacter tibetensis TaxID=2972951 RepID=UPI00214DDFC3|nr:hypothetical protein [Parapedobacter tibetensis]
MKATMLSLLIVGGVFVPIGLKTIHGVRNGIYTNLDVSDQTQRQKWFIATTVLLLGVTIIIWVTDQDRTLRLAVTCALILLLVAQVVNIAVKASMHLAFHTFLGLLIFHFSWASGILFLFFSPFLAWSRLYLKRHVLKEIIVGIILGAIFGGVFLVLV